MLEQFCNFLQGQGKSENTVKSYRLAVDGYMKWYRATFGEPVCQLYYKLLLMQLVKSLFGCVI